MSKTSWKAVTILAVVAALVATPGVATAASAAAPVYVLPAEDEQVVRDFFDKFEVASSTQDRLIGEFEAGETWDSMSSSSEPASVELRSMDGVSWTVSEFADGSVRAEGIGPGGQLPGESARGVDGCGYSAGSYGNFSNCHIYYWVGLVQLGFYANFSILSGGNNDKITSAWGGTLFAGGACSQSVPSASIAKGTESSTGKAVAGLTAQATMCATSFTVNFPSYLHVGGNTASHVYS